ncbi:hypothetical protein T08_15579 [Trichinella sp. T8]|nr:hypothetical protein T08_15579 [Trichinella sp. T8]
MLFYWGCHFDSIFTITSSCVIQQSEYNHSFTLQLIIAGTDDPGKEEKEMTRPSGEKANAPLT